jgi:nitrite reductase (NADH) small subunit
MEGEQQQELEMVWKNVGALDNIPKQAARRLCFGHDGRPIAIFRTTGDAVFALVDECPHRRGPLSEGIISGETVTCPLHNWVIGLRDGIAVAPDEGHTATLPVRIVAGEVHVGLPRIIGKAA